MDARIDPREQMERLIRERDEARDLYTATETQRGREVLGLGREVADLEERLRAAESRAARAEELLRRLRAVPHALSEDYLREIDAALRLAYSFLIQHAAECVRVATPDHLIRSGPQRATADWHEARAKDLGVAIRKSADAIRAAVEEEREKRRAEVERLSRVRVDEIARLFVAYDFLVEDEVPADDIEWRIRDIWESASKGHSGDCTKQPWTCALCVVERHREQAAALITALAERRDEVERAREALADAAWSLHLCYERGDPMDTVALALRAMRGAAHRLTAAESARRGGKEQQ